MTPKPPRFLRCATPAEVGGASLPTLPSFEVCNLHTNAANPPFVTIVVLVTIISFLCHLSLLIKKLSMLVVKLLVCYDCSYSYYQYYVDSYHYTIILLWFPIIVLLLTSTHYCMQFLIFRKQSLAGNVFPIKEQARKQQYEHKGKHGRH